MAEVGTICRPTLTVSGTPYIESGSGPALVFLHGVGMNYDIWAPQMDYFAPKARVLAYDLLGHGGSPLPPLVPMLGDFTRQLVQLLDERDITRASIVGHSMGALIGLDFALNHSARTERLVAINAVYARSDNQRCAVGQRSKRLKAESNAEILSETVNRWFSDEQFSKQSAAIRNVRTWLSSVDAKGYARAYEIFSKADSAFVGRLGELQVPALFMTGALDPNSTPAMSRRMADEAPYGEAAIVPEERHMMAYMAPDRVNPILSEFLTRSGEATRG